MEHSTAHSIYTSFIILPPLNDTLFYCVNLRHKDRLFCLLFGSEQYRENILELYNALNDTAYKDVADIELYTISDVIYIKMKNDVAFIFDSYLSLWEQQSSHNPNMPVRGLMYFGNMYNKYIKSNELNIYGTQLIKLPTPRYIVFYNGTEDRAPVEKLRLSDAFTVPDKTGDFEWTATVYNLNKGKNDVLLEKCKPLREYMILINRIRLNLQGAKNLENAVDSAVTSCIEDGILREFLLAHRAEVLNMVITEFDEKSFVKGIREEGRLQGLAEGRSQGLAEGRSQGLTEGQAIEQHDIIAKMLRKGKSPEEIADFCGYPMDLILDVQNSLLESK
ncbi:hypothetical protein [Oribacterium sp. WCC10]|uniref:hypothetical protein n=1 Tax=Oribacterium sp. WCC10 TaxID=1855343 RepID=UPI0008F34335|nr:hypothetical protein [Oribacterium sp. WCC10]SFG46184.1 hypothetical protein SAMN05216356_109100 [Oribacterium sp. WCC10]